MQNGGLHYLAPEPISSKHSMSRLSEVLTAVATERLAELSAKSFDDLIVVPNQSEQEEIFREEYKLIATVYHDKLESGEHRFVVQVGKPGWLAMTWRLCANAFVINNRNERRALVDEELWEFM
jgi:hypothetical protein